MPKFNAKLIPQGPAGAWTRVDLPFNAEKTFGTKGRVSVQGTINGFPFRSSIFPNGDGTHHLMVNKAMKAGAGANSGDEVVIHVEADSAPRLVEVPEDLRRALKKSEKADATFEAFSYSMKKEYVEWIVQAKKAETRSRRIEKAISMILQKERVKG